MERRDALQRRRYLQITFAEKLSAAFMVCDMEDFRRIRTDAGAKYHRNRM